MSKPSKLPSVLPALWRSLRLGFAAEPWLFAASFVLAATAWIPIAILALWLKLLATERWGTAMA